MISNKIYIPLQGRIGNQLFQYAFARKVQKDMGEGTEIVISDHDVLKCKWENSLLYYHLPNVTYTHERLLDSELKKSEKWFYRKLYRFFTRKQGYMEKYQTEIKLNRILGKKGIFICENGFIEPKLNYQKPIYLEGYFQSLKYFESIEDDIYELFNGKQFQELEKYEGLRKLQSRNSICISVKVEHNVGSSIYDVCSIEYWEKAIKYIIENVDNPLFFVCSDNVDYVLKNLIDTRRFDYVIQDKKMPVHVSLAAMAECKHFIIGNTTFGWWAQYLSKYPPKIVVAPSRWMRVDMPIDIYQDNWYLIEV